MRVETIQEAIEGAPALVLPDGEGGATFHLVTDEALQRVASDMAEVNGWTVEERRGLYEAMADFVDRIGDLEVPGD